MHDVLGSIYYKLDTKRPNKGSPQLAFTLTSNPTRLESWLVKVGN